MTGNDHFYKKVSSRPAVDAGLPFLPDTDALSVINSCRNGYLDLLAACNITGSAAVCTFFLNDLSCSVTFRTGLDISDCAEEGLLGKDYSR